MPDKELKDKYDAIAFQINREDELVSKRFTWSLTINGFLFGVMGLISTAKDIKVDDIPFPVSAVPWVGFLVSVAAFIGIIAANMQIYYLKKEWDKLKEVLPWVRPFGNNLSFFLGWVPQFLPSLVLVMVWIIVLCR